MKHLITATIFITFFCSQGMASGYKTQKIIYQSKNIFGFEKMFGSALKTQPDHETYGVLHFPDNFDGSKRYPLIIASHGSLNWGEHHSEYIEQMRNANFLVFAMHAFDSRGATSTVGNQTNVTGETVMYEMAMALNLFWDDPRVNQKKIYAAGWSMGAMSALFNAWLPLQREINKPGASFSGYLMWYPGCLALPDGNAWDKDFMQIYIGEADNWTPASTCQAIVSRINASGGRAHIEIYPGAYHTFDGKGPLTLWPDAYSWVECGFRISDTTKKVYDPANPNVDFSNLESRIEAYKSCAKKGEVMAGSSPKYNRAAYRHLAKILPSLR